MQTKLRFSKFLYSFAVIVSLSLGLPQLTLAGSVCVDNVSSGTTASTTDSSMTVSHTTNSGADRLMLVGISVNVNDDERVSTVTYNGTPLTKVGERNNGNDAMVYIYRLVAPDLGTHNVVINFDSALNYGAIAGVMTFTGVHQTTPLGTFASAIGDDTATASVDIASAAGELVFGVVTCEYDPINAATTGQEIQWNTTTANNNYGAGGIDNGASTVTMTWGFEVASPVYNHWAVGGISIKPASGKNLVMVTGDGSYWSGFDDNGKKTLFESWGWTVTAIADDATQTTFDNAAANNDVMYISESCASTTVGTKARDLDIGIVTDEDYLWDEMEFGATGDSSAWHNTITINDNSHYITSPFSTGNLAVYTAYQDICKLPTTLASGGQLLASENESSYPTLFAFETGATLYSGTAVNRRVGFPCGESTTSIWTANLKTLLQRSLDWAAGFCGAGGAATCGTNLVMVTQTGDFSSGYDTAKKTLFESWGWTVTAIQDLNGDYSGAASSNDVMFISESVTSSEVGTQATNLDIGILVEESALQDEMELCSSQNYTSGATGTQIDIVDNTHYIASTLSTGPLTIYSSTDSLIINQATPAPGVVVVAEEIGGDDTALVAIHTGETLDNGAAAVNRRVGFIGMHESNPSNWTTSMQTLVQRSLDWAAGCGAAGGGTNSAPVLNTIGDKNVTVGELLEFTISGTDPDTGDTLTYSASNLPAGASFDPGTQTFSWTPSALDVGVHSDVEFTVTDDGTPQENDSELITITVYGAAPPPDLSGYSCNMKITIDSVKVAGDLNYFPVLIDVTDESLKTSGCGFMTDPDGDDLIFTNAAKSLQLDHEIEKYDGSAGELVAWVKIPFLSGSTNTDIYMYYGNSGVTTAQENPTGVWDENGADDYVGVWHLHDDYQDSTSYNNDGNPNNMDPFAAGQVGNAGTFDGTDDYVVVVHDSSLQMSDEITVSAWINPDDVWNWRTIVSKMSGTNSELYFVLEDQTMILKLNGPMSSDWWSGVSVYEDQWAYVAFTYSNTTDTVTMYRNGGADTDSISRSGTLNLSSNTNSLYIGANTGWPGEDFDGHIDEVRISRVARSAQWIQTSYNNQNSPSSFYSTEVKCPSQAEPENFTCSLEITIDNTMVSGSSNLANFPVLFTLTNDALIDTSHCGFVSNSNGYDIMFTDSNDNQLDHEIVKYDGTTGELVAWVKKTISPTADDPQNIIKLYYGNSGVCGALEKPTNVWDSNYEVVLHLQESGTGASNEFRDSTSNGHHGTGGGLAGAGDSSMTPSRVPGKFGYAQDFDGGNDLIRLNGVDDGSWTAVTVQAWINPDDTGDDRLFGKCWGTGSDDETWLLRKPSGGNFGVRMRTDTNYNGGYDPGSLTISTWQHVAAIWSASDNQLRVFKNGVQQGATTLNGSHLFSNSSGETGYPDSGYADEPTLGNTPGNDRDYNGKMQEARVSKIARSADWLLTEYNNQSDPSSFYSVTNNTCSIPEPNPAEFSCWRPITIDKDYVMGSTDLVNFPLLVKINSDPLLEISNPPTDCGKVKHPDGYDIIFTDQYGTELLDHEIETYNSGTGQLVAWVRIPQLSTFSDTVIRMYYGNANIGCPTENPAGVWDSNYVGVWHLSDTSGDTQDSTSYATSGTLSGSVSRGSWSNIYNSFNFGDSGELDWGDPAHLNAGTQSWTVSLWANIDYNRGSGMWEKIINKGKNSWQAGYEMELDDYNNNLYFAINDGSTEWGPSTGTSFTTDTWTYFVGVVDRTTQYIRLYKNGEQAGSSNIGSYGSIDVGDNLTIGKDTWGWPDARIEEVRVSNTARSADWIKTEWYNQNGSVAFYTLGDDSCETEYAYQYCQKITIDHNKVSGSSHSDFPLLVKLTTDDLKWVNNGGLVENEFGYDIAFKDENCTMLDYELESYDKDTGTLAAWVRIPSLSGSTDTEIYMYYGNPFIECPSDNPTGVWNSYYQAVYHLNDDFQDSTSNDRDGTNHGATFATGKIGNGALFDPTDGYDYIDIGTWSVSGDDITVQAWVYPETFNQNDPRIVSKCDDDSASEDNHVFMLSLYNGNNGENRLRLRIRGTYDDSYDQCVGGCDPSACVYPCYWNTVWYTVTDTLTLYGSDPNGYLPTAQAWYFVAGNYEDDNSTEMQLYRDDGLNAGGRDHNGNLVTNTWDVWIGASPYGSNNTDYSWHGVIDEVRILSMDLSQDWLRTEYNNINDPSSFYSLGACTRAITPVTSEWREEIQ